MPLYRYGCPTCGIACDAFRKIDERDQAPVHCDGAMVRKIMPTMVSVFEPYQAVAAEKDGGECPVIRTQREHEAFLRRNGYEEVGNDKSMAPPSPEKVAESHAQQRKELAEQKIYSEQELLEQGFVSEPLDVPT